MKVTFDPSSLLWDENLAKNYEYIEVATTIVELLEWLEDVPVEVLMPEDAETLYGDFPYAIPEFRPQVRHVSQLFWAFLTRYPNRVELISALQEPVSLNPNIVPARIEPHIAEGLRGFFGAIVTITENTNQPVKLLSGSPKAFNSTGGDLLVAVTQQALFGKISVLASLQSCQSAEPDLDWRPAVDKCIEAVFYRRYSSLQQAKLREFKLSPTISEQLNSMMYDDENLYWEVIDCMARWAGGITTGIKPHKIGKQKRTGQPAIKEIYRLDVRYGSGDKVHAVYGEDGGVEFLVYQDEHDRYKVNKLG